MTSETVKLPLLPLRDIVVFPFMVIPLFVGREKSVLALEKSMAEQKNIFLAAQRNPNNNDPEPSDIYETGTLANILQILKLTDGTMKILVEGIQRGRIQQFNKNSNYYEVEVVRIQENEQTTPSTKALIRSVGNIFEQYVKLNQKIPLEAVSATANIAEPHRYADTIAAYMVFQTADKQDLLETYNPADRLNKLMTILKSEMERYAQDLGIHPNVIFTGWRRDLPRIYADLDLLVVSSNNEGTPVSAIEAMASGCPVVATRVGGIPDVVQDRETGYLVPPKQPQALTAAILKLIRDSKKAKQMGRAAQLSVEKRFSLDRLVRDTENLYEELLSSKKLS